MTKIGLNKKISLSVRSPKTAINVLGDKAFGIKKNKFPRVIDLFVTEACNFACPMCHVKESREKKNKIGGLNFVHIKKIIEESKKHSPTFQIIGGEPTLYKYILETIQLINDNRMISGLTTNGLLLEKYALGFVDSGLNFLAISLDGWDEESQKKRGNVPGSFDKIIKGIEKVIKLRDKNNFPNIRVATVITKNNYKDLEKIGQVLKDLNIDTWSISNYYFAPNKILSEVDGFYKKTNIGADIWADKVGEGNYFTSEDVETLKKQLGIIKKLDTRFKIDYDWSIDLDKYYSLSIPSSDSVCIVPYNEIFIRGNGDLELCQAYKLGNIAIDKIEDVWQGDKIKYFRKVFEENKMMPACFRCCALNAKFDK